MIKRYEDAGLLARTPETPVEVGMLVPELVEVVSDALDGAENSSTPADP